MYDKINYKALLFKLTHVVILSALFFVQLQVKFIESAYNDYSYPSYSNTSFSHQTGKEQISQTDNNSDRDGYTKLNKRYPSNNLFIFVSAPIIVRTGSFILSLLPTYTSPFLRNILTSAQTLRGPPAC